MKQVESAVKEALRLAEAKGVSSEPAWAKSKP